MDLLRTSPDSSTARGRKLAAGGFVVLLLFGGTYAGFDLWRGYQRAKKLEALQAALRVSEDEAWASLEREQGFSRSEIRHWPQVTAPEDLAEREGPTWSGVVAHPPRHAAVGREVRGVVVEWSDGRGLRLADAQVDLSAALRAERPDEVVWVAMIHRTVLEDAYSYGTRRLSVERVDARLALLDGTLLARGTLEALPPREASRTARRRFPLDPSMVATFIEELMQAARSAPERADVNRAPPECIADRVPSEPSDRESHEDCARGATTVCIAHCRTGHGRSCAEAAYTLEHAGDTGTLDLYRLGCIYGDYNACTNWAATVRNHFSDDDAALACAARVFERTCEGGEHFGCGMLGIALATGQGVEEDVARARTLLESSCNLLGQFPCDALGRVRDGGVFGDDQRALAAEAFERACATGYAPACDRAPEEPADPPADPPAH